MSFPEPTASRGIFHIALKSLPRFSMSNSRVFPSVTGTSTHMLSGGGTLRACAVLPLPSGVPEAWLGVTGHPTSLSRHTWAGASLRGITGATCSQKNCSVDITASEIPSQSNSVSERHCPGGTAGSPRPGPVLCRPVNYMHTYADGRGERETAGQGGTAWRDSGLGHGHRVHQVGCPWSGETKNHDGGWLGGVDSRKSCEFQATGLRV